MAGAPHHVDDGSAQALTDEVASVYRNATPLLERMTALLAEQSAARAGGRPLDVVELGSGTGDHAAFMVHNLAVKPAEGTGPLVRRWQPTDLPAANQQGAVMIAKYRERAGATVSATLLPAPLPVDSSSESDWKATLSSDLGAGCGRFDACFTSCTFHIMAWETCEAALLHLGRVVLSEAPGSFVAIYGPLNYGGKFTSESNERFDGWLRNSVKGGARIKGFEEMQAAAAAGGLSVLDDLEMPENNRLLVLGRPRK